MLGHFHPLKRPTAAMLAATLCLGPVACDGSGGEASVPSKSIETALALVRPERLRDHVEILADEGREGRVPASSGHDFSRDYIAQALSEAGVEAAGTDGRYIHTYDTTPRFRYPGIYTRGQNLIAIRRGSDPARAHETVVVMAHYDHLGVRDDGESFNGAYDDAAGVAVLLELARAYELSGYRARRSILFLITDEEEPGLVGARAWVANPTLPLENVVFAVSADPVGRPNLPGYAWTGIFGLERSPELEVRVRDLAPELGDGDVIVANRDVIRIFASDQDAFHEAGIPAAWFVNPGFSFYHQPTDTPETIDYRVLLEASRVLARLVDVVANDDQRYDYVDAPPISIESTRPFRTVFRRFLETDGVLGPVETQQVNDIIARINEIEAVGTVDPDRDGDFFLGALATLFLLSVNHPGPIPPPFPTGQSAASP